jgi:hypothetical protein
VRPTPTQARPIRAGPRRGQPARCAFNRKALTLKRYYTNTTHTIPSGILYAYGPLTKRFFASGGPRSLHARRRSTSRHGAATPANRGSHKPSQGADAHLGVDARHLDKSSEARDEVGRLPYGSGQPASKASAFR